MLELQLYPPPDVDGVAADCDGGGQPVPPLYLVLGQPGILHLLGGPLVLGLLALVLLLFLCQDLHGYWLSNLTLPLDRSHLEMPGL